jgi:hypothetical protein
VKVEKNRVAGSVLLSISFHIAVVFFRGESLQICSVSLCHENVCQNQSRNINLVIVVSFWRVI